MFVCDASDMKSVDLVASVIMISEELLLGFIEKYSALVCHNVKKGSPLESNIKLRCNSCPVL